MRRLPPALRFLLYSAAAILVALGAVALWQRHAIVSIIASREVLFEGADWAERVKDDAGLLDYLAAHPESVSWVLWDAGHEASALTHHADQPRSLASTAKILVLSAYARAVEQGTIDPETRVPLSEWDALYLPGTDGGSHLSALAELEGRGGIADEHVPLREIARAMIAHSDNAATDLLLLRLGRQRIDAEPAALSLPSGNEAPFPIGGALLLSTSPPEGTLPLQWLGDLSTRGRDFVRDESWRFAGRLQADAAFRKQERDRLERSGIGLSLKEQLVKAKEVGPRGTARGYARVMEAVITAPASSRWAYLMAQALEWPLQRSEQLRDRYDRFGTKGGSLPGVITAARFATPKGQPPRVMALFMEDLPFLVYATLMKNFVQQDLERRILEDPRFAREVHARLRGTADAGR